jgi:hypothetical protein
MDATKGIHDTVKVQSWIPYLVMCLRLVINTVWYMFVLDFCYEGFLSRDVFNYIEIFIDDRCGLILLIGDSARLEQVMYDIFLGSK